MMIMMMMMMMMMMIMVVMMIVIECVWLVPCCLTRGSRATITIIIVTSNVNIINTVTTIFVTYVL